MSWACRDQAHAHLFHHLHQSQNLHQHFATPTPTLRLHFSPANSFLKFPLQSHLFCFVLSWYLASDNLTLMCRPVNSTAGALVVIGILVNKWDLLENTIKWYIIPPMTHVHSVIISVLFKHSTDISFSWKHCVRSVCDLTNQMNRWIRIKPIAILQYCWWQTFYNVLTARLCAETGSSKTHHILSNRPHQIHSP